MGLLCGDGVLDDLGEAGDRASQRRFGLAREPPDHARRRCEPRLGRLPQDRGDPGVGVLDVVDRVLVRLLLGQLDVEVDGGRGSA